MSLPWIIAFAALALVVLLQGVVLAGLLRRFAGALERLDSVSSSPLRSPLESGLPPGVRVPDFDLVDRDGARVRFDAVRGDAPILVLLTQEGCSACERLLASARGEGAVWPSAEVPLLVITEAPESDLTVGAVYRQLDRSAALGLDSAVSPHAFLIDGSGIVVERKVPGSWSELKAMASPERVWPVATESPR